MNNYDEARDSVARADLINSHLPAGSKILDFGAYRGVISRRLAQHGHTVTAVSPELTDTTGITGIRGTLTPDGILKLGSFDAALCLSVLHHLSDWRDYVEALSEVAPVVFYEHAVGDEDNNRVAGHPSHRSAIVSTVTGQTIGQFPGKDSSRLRPVVLVRG